MSSRRYAIYFAPEINTDLARQGWAWLGRRPDIADYLPLPPRQALWVAEPRLYGFHATLKAPFHLVDGATGDDLRAALTRFAGLQRPFTDDPLRLAEIDGFLALIPTGPAAKLRDLAAALVRDFDGFRAAPSPEEHARRLSARLTERQRRYLDQWGYPFVFDDFQPHLTLTGRLGADERAACRDCLEHFPTKSDHALESARAEKAPLFQGSSAARACRILPADDPDRSENALAPLTALAWTAPLAVASVCLFEQDAVGTPFLLTERFPFGSPAGRNHVL